MAEQQPADNVLAAMVGVLRAEKYPYIKVVPLEPGEVAKIPNGDDWFYPGEIALSLLERPDEALSTIVKRMLVSEEAVIKRLLSGIDTAPNLTMTVRQDWQLVDRFYVKIMSLTHIDP